MNTEDFTLNKQEVDGLVKKYSEKVLDFLQTELNYLQNEKIIKGISCTILGYLYSCHLASFPKKNAMEALDGTKKLIIHTIEELEKANLRKNI
jgi:hypothetical protein